MSYTLDTIGIYISSMTCIVLEKRILQERLSYNFNLLKVGKTQYKEASLEQY